MPIFQLTDSFVFPPPELADESGIIAIGGDLSPERLILAYQTGIFPWYNEGDPIIWHSPDPRFVLIPENLKVPKSMNKVFNQKIFHYTFDKCFDQVIKECSISSRPGQQGTWILPEMIEAYCELHRLGYAHSVEVWKENELVGGLYGISLGKCFFGESMFSKADNASKAALIVLTRKLDEVGFLIIDSQVYTRHIAKLGAEEIPREKYLSVLHKGLQFRTIRGNWGTQFNLYE
jgi:leucyl/phenylalanyl-tRNA---protein transferase